MFGVSLISRSLPLLRNRAQMAVPAVMMPFRKLSLTPLSSLSTAKPTVLGSIGYMKAFEQPKTVSQTVFANRLIVNDPMAQLDEVETEDNTIYMDSVLRKRRLKMKKHKLRKRRRAQRSLKKRLGKL